MKTYFLFLSLFMSLACSGDFSPAGDYSARQHPSEFKVGEIIGGLPVFLMDESLIIDWFAPILSCLESDFKEVEVRESFFAKRGVKKHYALYFYDTTNNITSAISLVEDSGELSYRGGATISCRSGCSTGCTPRQLLNGGGELEWGCTPCSKECIKTSTMPIG